MPLPNGSAPSTSTASSSDKTLQTAIQTMDQQVNELQHRVQVAEGLHQARLADLKTLESKAAVMKAEAVAQQQAVLAAKAQAQALAQLRAAQQSVQPSVQSTSKASGHGDDGGDDGSGDD